MSEVTRPGGFIGYEYANFTVNRDMEAMYADGYQNFGWMLESVSTPQAGVRDVTMRFKRDRKIRNKAELTRLQRQFDACAAEITGMERSKAANAITMALIVGLLGTAFLAGATFAYLGGLAVFGVVLAIPGFVGWALPYFLYNATYMKKAAVVDPLIEKKRDEVYELCERANALLGN
ncbi:conserved hypothetical protein [uncultured Eubacteriales bacterium]|uniref:Uncharacterized protein n=1 Tax=uncultured Eubacteriales bacterium TaxID=172733 RepID=A0A212KFP1_9FIRM|nr:conserved hypothetical protein [uncultured Eubacteriales bacterium]